MEQVISVRLLGGDALGSYKVATVKDCGATEVPRTFSIQDEKMSGEGRPLLG